MVMVVMLVDVVGMVGVVTAKCRLAAASKYSTNSGATSDFQRNAQGSNLRRAVSISDKKTVSNAADSIDSLRLPGPRFDVKVH